MKTFLSSLLVFLATNYVCQRGWYWEVTKRFRRTKQITVSMDKTFCFANFGLIAKRLYEQEPLVRYNKGFEQKTIDIILRIVQSDFVTLDIGANIGLHSLVMASCFEKDSSCRVYAFEPSKKTFDALGENIKLNGFEDRIVALNAALSDKPGRLMLATPDEYTKLGKNSDPYKSLQKSPSANGTGEEVEVITLDNWAKSNNVEKIDFIKIDIEGAELECFKGALEVFRKRRPIMVMECYEPFCSRFGYSVSDVVLFMNEVGYKMFQYEESQWIAIPKEKILAVSLSLADVMPGLASIAKQLA